MSRPIDFSDVVARVAEFGQLATLVSVTSEGAPHLGTVLVTAGANQLDARVGSRTREHVRVNPSVTLTWLRADRDYQLIIDGVAVASDEPGPDGLFAVSIDPRHGILHRLAGQTDGPTCRSLNASLDA